jgi:hypothetical protein
MNFKNMIYLLQYLDIADEPAPGGGPLFYPTNYLSLSSTLISEFLR